MRMNHIEIKNKGILAEIFIDGHKLSGVRSYELKQSSGEVPTLTVDLNALNISVDETVLLMQKGFGEINIEFQELSEDNSDEMGNKE